MKRLLLALGALSFSGCFNYDYAIAVCHDAGGCRPVEDAGSSDAGSDAGGADAGTPDAGGLDAGDPSVPVFFTSSGWAWEFPFPAAPGLHSLSAVSDDEVWAGGEDESVLHFVGGAITFSRPGTSRLPTESAWVLALPDGGVLVAGPDSIYQRRLQGWTTVPFPYSTRAAELGASGAPWFGGQWQNVGGPDCQPRGGVVVEGFPPGRPLCTSPVTGDDYVVGFDPQGWGLDSSGVLLRREAAPDGGVSWPVVARAPVNDYPRCDVLALSAEDVLVAGFYPGRSVVLHLDGGVNPFSVTGSLTEEWSSLVRTTDQQAFFVGGRSGVSRCNVGPVPACALEVNDVSQSLETLSAGPTALFASGEKGQLLRRDADGGWATLHEGGADALNDVWADADGQLWVVGNGGWLMHRGPSGWERLKISDKSLYSIARTSDGFLWIGGVDVLGRYDPTQNVLVAPLLPGGGGPWSSEFNGKAFTSIGGGEPGNTWAISDGMLLRYEGAEVWRSEPFPTAHGSGIDGLFVTDAGTAWAVGGNSSRVVLYWDGSTWLDRTPDGGAASDTLYAVWGPSSTEVFISGEVNGYHFLSDGGVASWNVLRAVTLAGGATRDGGFVLFAGRDKEVQRMPNGLGGAPLPNTNAPGGRGMNRLRLLGSKLYAVGSRDDAFTFMLSFDAGL